MDTGNRPQTWQRLRIGAMRDGTLKAMSVVSYGTAGVALSAGFGKWRRRCIPVRTSILSNTKYSSMLDRCVGTSQILA